MRKLSVKDRICIGLSIICISILACYIYIIARYRPWIGDDAIFCFEGALSYYINYGKASEPYVGNRITEITQVIGRVIEYYTQWGGRLLTGVVDPLMVIAGKTTSAIITSAIFIGILINSLKLVYKKTIEIFRHPLELICVGALLLMYNSTMSHSISRVFINLYGLSFMLYFMLLNLNEQCMKNDEVNSGNIFTMNALGLLAGISHELLGIWFMIQLLLQTVLTKRDIKSIFIHFRYFCGLAIGYTICVVAPGNFARMKNSHEISAYNTFFDRFLESIKTHIHTFINYEYMGAHILKILIIIFIAAFIFLCTKGNHEYMGWVAEKSIYIAISVVLWSIPARASARGMYGAMVYVLIILLKVIYEAEKEIKYKEYISAVLACIVMLLVLRDCNSWMPSMVKQAVYREKLIALSVEKRYSEIVVPKFSEECDRNVFFLRYVNSQDEMNSVFQIKLNGTHIILE